MEIDVTDLFELASDWFWVMDQDLRYVYFSPRVEQVTGDPPEWHYGRTREELGIVVNSGEDRLRQRETYHGQLISRPGKDGKLIWIRSSGKPIYDEDGAFKGYIGTGSDVTAEIEAQREIEARHGLFVASMSTMSDGFALFDADDRLVFWNPSFSAMNPELARELVVGMTFEQQLRSNVSHGRVKDAVGREEEFIRDRIEQHRDPDGEPWLSERKDGRILELREVRLEDGSTFLLNTDLTDRIQREKELKASKEAADAANQAKSEFLSSMSHELRTPLNAILGFGQLLENDRMNPLSGAQIKAVQQILKGGEHLLSLIDEVLDLAKIEAGKTTLSIEEIFLETLFEEALPLISPMAARRGIRMTRPARLSQFTVQADYTRLKQIFLNLLSNAIKYNVESGRVDIEVREVADSDGVVSRIRIAIRDTGPGIPEERQAELFQPFSRAGAESTGVEGTGIGLTLSRRLAEMMRGNIDFTSQPGEGSTFWIDMPVGEGYGSREVALPLHDDEERLEVAKPASETYKVLYIEDNPANLALMEQIVETLSDARMLSAHSAELGLELAIAEHPNVILMDINLPGIDGLEALRQIRNRADIAHIPVVAVTADAVPKSIARGIEAGFHAYLTKPIRLDQIMELLEELRPKETERLNEFG